MTVDADRASANAQHVIARLLYAVVAVTAYALAYLPLVEHGLVRAGLEEFRLANVALPADVRDGRDAWRRGPVVAVAVVTGRRGNVLPLIECVGMNALLVVAVLICGNLVAAHVVCVRVTLGAGFRDVRGVDGRERIVDGAYVMNAVATYAGRYVLIPHLKPLAVHTREILALLVNAQSRVKFFHEVGVAMALAAEGRNL